MTNEKAIAHQCEVCKEAAALICPNCATGLDVHGQERKTYYCSKPCQAKDWVAGHKLECKVATDRRQLFRIGSLAQEAFYQSSKAIWFHGVSKVEKIEHVERDDDPKLLVWLSEDPGGVDFPAFPDTLFEGYRDERAILASATSAVAIMSALVEDLVQASKCHITMDVVGIRPAASQYMKVVIDDETGSETAPKLTGIFRATLRNGQVFAIDPRKAMYKFTATTEHEHGVFEWDSYMERLLVDDRVAIDVQPLRRFPPHPVTQGNSADGLSGKFAITDIRFTAEMKAICFFVTLGEGLRRQPQMFLPLENCHTSFAKLMNRSSTNDEHASEVSAFNKQLQEAIRLTRSMRIKEMLFDRLRLTEWN